MALGTLSPLFLLLCAATAMAVAGTFVRYLHGRARTVALAAFAAWLLYAGGVGYSGLVASKTPPGPVFLMGPAILFAVAYLTRREEVGAFARRIPPALLVGLQSFRVFVELAIFGLYGAGLVPRLMTFEGGNVDVAIGLTAPILAWLLAKRRLGVGTGRAWNYLGLLSLLNVVLRTVLTSGGPLGVVRTEVPNVGLGHFPFTFVPGLLAPLAVWLHVLSLRGLVYHVPVVGNPEGSRA